MLSALLFTSVALVGFADDDSLPDLCVGDPAPKLEVQEFVRGEPVKEFEPGKTYVVEFWATWCVPCRESIPHLTELQKTYKEVVFLGVSIDDDAKAVKPFVDKMGDKMQYRVAIDARDGDESKMAQSWLDASFQSGIPTAYIINRQGKIAWIGHPKDMEDPLERILAGKWDLAAKAADFKQAIAEERKQAAAKALAKKLSSRLGRALKDKRYEDALKAVEEAEAGEVEFPNQPFDMRVVHLAAMVIGEKDTSKAVELGKALLAKPSEGQDEVPPLAIVAAILDPDRLLEELNARSDGEADPHSNEVHFLAAPKLDPALASIAVAAADACVEGMAKEQAMNDLELADSHVLLAAAYRAGGEKKKALGELHKATDVLQAIAKQANEAVDKAHAAEKELGE